MKNVKRPKTEKADERPNEELPLKECRKRVKNNINTLKTTSKERGLLGQEKEEEYLWIFFFKRSPLEYVVPPKGYRVYSF